MQPTINHVEERLGLGSDVTDDVFPAEEVSDHLAHLSSTFARHQLIGEQPASVSGGKATLGAASLVVVERLGKSTRSGVPAQYLANHWCREAMDVEQHPAKDGCDRLGWLSESAEGTPSADCAVGEKLTGGSLR